MKAVLSWDWQQVAHTQPVSMAWALPSAEAEFREGTSQKRVSRKQVSQELQTEAVWFFLT